MSDSVKVFGSFKPGLYVLLLLLLLLFLSRSRCFLVEHSPCRPALLLFLHAQVVVVEEIPR